jgi:hypothetical protein
VNNRLNRRRINLGIAVALLAGLMFFALWQASLRPSTDGEASLVFRELSEMSGQDIRFYGLLLDQADASVANAEVVAQIRSQNGVQESLFTRKTTSDSGGFFSFTGDRGSSLAVSASKIGYVMAATNTLFMYSHFWPEAQRHLPIAEQPTVIRMWRKQGKSVSVPVQIKQRFASADRLAFGVDLREQRIVPANGDLQVVVQRSGDFNGNAGFRQWEMEIKSEAGGVIECDSTTFRNSFSAPAGGYEDRKAYKFDTRDGSFKDVFSKFFLVKSRQGQLWGKIHVTYAISLRQSGEMNLSIDGVYAEGPVGIWE